MKTLYKSVLILDPGSAHHGKKRDVILDGAKIVEIGSSLQLTRGNIVEAKQMVLSHGWIDTYAHFRDPGEEVFEDLQSGREAALAGGFKRVAIAPCTIPPMDHKSGIERLIHNNKTSSVEYIPLGTLSAGLKGEQLAEHYDMHTAGAKAFSDDKSNVSSGLMLRALDYVKGFDGLVMSFPHEPSLAPSGQVHEGITSVHMGVKGIPEVAEEMRLMRDIELLRYSQSRLHVTMISTSRSVELIKKAKKDGLRITCGVSPHHLMFTDQDCAGFDSVYKVMPPLRTKTHQKALIQGLKDGTIDVICSDHRPWDSEHKTMEFEYASEGMAGIQTTFQMVYAALQEHLPIAEIIALFTTKPAALFGIDLAPLEPGSSAAVTIVSLAEDSEFNSDQWASKSNFHPLYNQRLKGKIYA
jgi:dihydroorotase